MNVGIHSHTFTTMHTTSICSHDQKSQHWVSQKTAIIFIHSYLLNIWFVLEFYQVQGWDAVSALKNRVRKEVTHKQRLTPSIKFSYLRIHNPFKDIFFAQVYSMWLISWNSNNLSRQWFGHRDLPLMFLELKIKERKKSNNLSMLNSQGINASGSFYLEATSWWRGKGGKVLWSWVGFLIWERAEHVAIPHRWST